MATTTKSREATRGVKVRDLVTKTSKYVRGPIGAELREAREHLGMTQEDVARETAKIAAKLGARGVHVSTVRRAEQDTNRRGSWGTMRCRVLHANAVNLQIMTVPE